MTQRELPPPELRQTPMCLPAHLRSDAAPPIRVTPLTGTNGTRDTWALDRNSPLALTLASKRVYFIRASDGRPFRWQSSLAVRGLEAWDIGADSLAYFSERLPYEDRNYLAFSDGGQVVWRLAASGFKMRSVTFVGTPNRADVESEKAIRNIGMSQIVYDSSFDLIAYLGGLFSGTVSTDRSFAQLGDRMKRYPMKNIGHGGVLNTPALIRLWETEPWVDNIRAVSAKEAA
jgi:pimeloyl-ACP methyl ester carboxylesterase